MPSFHSLVQCGGYVFFLFFFFVTIQSLDDMNSGKGFFFKLHSSGLKEMRGVHSRWIGDKSSFEKRQNLQ